MDSDEFQRWSSESKQILFCPGIPGAGKTIITAIVVEHLCTKFRKYPNIGIAYLYCNFRRHQEQKPIDLLAGLLKQLIQRRPSLPEKVIRLHEKHNKDRTSPSSDEISKVLQSTVAEYSRTFIIIDALDECQFSEGSRRKFLLEIFSLQAKTGANVFATSRFIPEIIREFEEGISLEIQASNEDVRRYLEGRMSQLPSCVLKSRDLQEKIVTEIIQAADKMHVPPPGAKIERAV